MGDRRYIPARTVDEQGMGSLGAEAGLQGNKGMKTIFLMSEPL